MTISSIIVGSIVYGVRDGGTIHANREAMRRVRALQDYFGRYIWEPQFRVGGRRATLAGVPIQTEPSTPDGVLEVYREGVLLRRVNI